MPGGAEHSGDWCPRPAAGLVTRSTRRSARPACAPRVPRRHPEDCCAAGQGCGRRASRPVGRVLCTRSRGPTAIHLGLPLPAASCGLPASSGGPPSIARAGPRPQPRNPSDLAPGGVYLAARVTPGAGGLLHHRFTLTPGQAGGGLLSVALSRGSPRVGVTDHPALRSPDLPHRGQSPARPPGRLARRLVQHRGPAPYSRDCLRC